MIDRHLVFEIHRLSRMGFSERQIARELRIDRQSVSKYLQNPDPAPARRAGRPSKLDPYRDIIEQIVADYPAIKAPAVLQYLQQKGFDGRVTIVRDYLHTLRRAAQRRAYCRFESGPGRQMQVDWGHFWSLEYGRTKRKLYALVVLECHSRMLHVTFTHSQCQADLHQGLLAAFTFLGGTCAQLVVDNMLTAVTERVGALVRFNAAFLDFLRPFHITPVPCNIRSPHEKGKVENSVKYLRTSFWPLRQFKDLADVQNQIDHWRDTVANTRVHQTTKEVPKERFCPDRLRPLPDHLPDCRQAATVLVHKDFAVRFDGNAYSVPPWAIGKKITVKADTQRIWCYDKDRLIATHFRSWHRGGRIELPAHAEQVKKLKNRIYQDRLIRVFLSLGPIAADYLEQLENARQPMKKTVTRLLKLRDVYGEVIVLSAVKKAADRKLYGAEYVENIVYQEIAPQKHYDPVRLKNPDLNRICLESPCLEDYDAIAVKQRRNHDGKGEGQV
ncbi:MAG: IS21 family transposase [candidate division Zixibacteria bacterium]|nr:IS21 family transposase [candidate division Zixibacteria bacterium]